MRHIHYILIFFFVQNLFAQFEWGVKVGASFPSDTKLLTILQENNRIEMLENKLTGMQLGVYGQFELASIFIRPELQYANTQLKFKNFNYSQGALELPVSVGLKLLPVLSAYLGPSIQYRFGEKIKDVAFFEEVKKESTIGFHFGTRVHLGSLGIGLRYERAFSSNEIKVIENNLELPFGFFDNRPKQILLDLSFRF